MSVPLHEAHMPPPHLRGSPRRPNGRSSRPRVMHRLRIARHLLELVLRHQPLLQRGSWVCHAVGQVFRLHLSAWMQPSENMKPRAEVTKSAPAQIAQATSPGHDQLAAGDDADALLQPVPVAHVHHPRQRLASGMPTRSISGIGAAPVPPSPPSTVMKSGAQSGPRAGDRSNSPPQASEDPTPS